MSVELKALLAALVDAGIIPPPMVAKIEEYTRDEINVLTVEKERAKGITNEIQDGILTDIDQRRRTIKQG